jgi:hypothetical protein
MAWSNALSRAGPPPFLGVVCIPGILLFYRSVWEEVEPSHGKYEKA